MSRKQAIRSVIPANVRPIVDRQPSTNFFEFALNHIERGLSMFDAGQRLVICNRMYGELYDLPNALIQPGTQLRDLICHHIAAELRHGRLDHIPDHQAWIDLHAAKIACGQPFKEVRELANGRTIEICVYPTGGGGWVDIQEDISDRRAQEEKISWLARHDTLTEISNRHYFMERLHTTIDGLADAEMLAVLWIDLDGFKKINDTFGHSFGDAVLQSVGSRLRATIRGHDFLGRLGGDEFAIAQLGIAEPAQAMGLAQRLLRVLGKPHIIHGRQLCVRASIGIALAPLHGTDARDLLNKADTALYRVKGDGRGFSQIYSD